LSCRVLSWPAGVQKDPHTAVGVLLGIDGVALDPLSDSIHRSAEMIGCLRDANTLGGRMSCRVLSALSHTGDTRPLGTGPKGLRSHPRDSQEVWSLPHSRTTLVWRPQEHHSFWPASSGGVKTSS
jgi:hypothetical protein